MAFGFIKDQQNSGASGTSLNLTMQATKQDSLVVVTCKFVAAVSAVSVTDDKGNTYAAHPNNPITATGGRVLMFYGVQLVSGATTLTVSWTTSSASRITADEFSGGMKTNATVFRNGSSGSGTGTSGSVTGFSPTAGDLVVAGLHLNSGASVTAGSNYLLANSSTSSPTEYRQSAPGTSETCPISWTGSVGWAELAAAFIPYPGSTNFMAAL